MGTISTIKRWAYPFALRDAQAPNTMWRHFIALSAMDAGFFPIATSGFPNGSIHIGEECDGFVTEDGFRCLADGEVVAYRLDGMDQILRYEDESVLRYTSGFVLVRHRMALPPPGATDGSTPAADSPTSTEADDEGVAVFSLYSYNRPFARYPIDRDGFLKVSLPFWQGSREYRVGTRANDTQVPPAVAVPPSVWTPFGPIAHESEAEAEDAVEPLPAPATGLRVRAEGKASGRILGLLPRGCLLTVHGDATQGWAQIDTIGRGTPLPYTAGEPVPDDIASGWVLLDELDSTIRPAPFDDVVVLKESYPVKAGECIGFLGENPGKGSAKKHGGVQASDPRVAIEVFAGDDFLAYLAESRRRAALLPDSEKPILVIEKGARLCRFPRSPEHVAAPGHRVIPDPGAPSSGAFVRGQLYRVEARSPHIPLERGEQYGDYVSTTDDKRVTEAAYAKLPAAKKAKYSLRDVLTRVDVVPCWGDALPTRYIAVWTSTPLVVTDADAVVGAPNTFSRADLDALDVTRRFVDQDGTHWWQVEVTGEDHRALHAWVCERNHPKTRWESPHAWPGFTIADGTMFEPMEALQRFVCLTGEVHPTHEESFTPVANALNMSELVVALEKAIDHAGTLDGKVTADDIAHARRTPSLARGLSRVIARFQSQWSDNVERWEALTPLMDADWPVEMQRQKKRAWWNAVAGKVEGFPGDPHVHHIHPFGWVDNFIAQSPSMAWGKRVSAAFKSRVAEICKSLDTNPDWLMSCMAFETGESFSASKINSAGSGATGLIQFMPSTAIFLGTTTANLASMTAVDQLEYVHMYFKDDRGRLTSLDEMYLRILYPSAMGKADDHVVFKANLENPKSLKHKQYEQNAGLDKDRNRIVTRGEVVATIRRVYEKGMSTENYG